MSIFVVLKETKVKQLNTTIMKTNIIASFFLDTHEKEFNHFLSLFGSRYVYRYTQVNGRRLVDVIDGYVS